MDNEFDKQASKILRESLDGERWSDEYDIKEVTDTDDLEYANLGDAFLFDKVAEYAQAEEEVIEKESDVMDFLNRFGEWELKDNAYGAIVVKTGEAHNEMQPPDKDFDDEQRDQDPHRHKGLSDFEAEQRDQDPFRHTPGR